MLILSIWSYIQKPTILILNRNSKYNLKTHTRSPNSAINLDNTWGSFSRRKVMTSDPSDILLLISRKILSTLSDTGSIKQNKKTNEQLHTPKTWDTKAAFIEKPFIPESSFTVNQGMQDFFNTVVAFLNCICHVFILRNSIPKIRLCIFAVQSQIHCQ